MTRAAPDLGELEAKRASIRTMFGCVDEADWDALADVFHPELVYERPGYPPFVGRDRVLRFYREERLVASGRHEIDAIVIEGDVGASWGRMRGTMRDGARAQVEFAEAYVFDDGAVRLRRSYFFTAAV